MSKNLTPEQRKKRTEMLVKIVGLLGISLVLGPFSLVILHGLGALVALVGAAIVCVTAVNFLPWFAMKLANWRLKAIKSEAMKNPVETLQNEYVKKQEALGSFKENIRIFAGQVLSFADQVKQYVKDGLEDADVYTEQLSKMRQLLKLRQDKYSEAQQTLAEFAETIQRTDRKWKMACAAMKMNEAAGQMAGDAFDKICIETALDSVQTKLNQSFADLEVALLDDNKAKAVLAEKNQAASSKIAIPTDSTPGSNRQRIATT